MTTETTELAIRPQAVDATIVYSPEERQLILDSFIPGATVAEAAVLIRVSEVMGLNVFKRQIYFVKRKVKNQRTDQWEERWTFQPAIDGYRGKAEESGEYEGQDEPTFSFEDVVNAETGAPTEKKELVARVTVYRKGRRPAVGVARYSEFVQLAQGVPVAMWKKMPRNQLAKCAEVQAFRKAFPDRCGTGDSEDEGIEVRRQIAPADVRPVIDGEITEQIAPTPWPDRFARCGSEAALAAALADYQTLKDSLKDDERKAAAAAYKVARATLATGPVDAQTGEVQGREVGEEG